MELPGNVSSEAPMPTGSMLAQPGQFSFETGTKRDLPTDTGMYSMPFCCRFVCPDVLGKPLIMLGTRRPGEDKKLLGDNRWPQRRLFPPPTQPTMS